MGIKTMSGLIALIVLIVFAVVAFCYLNSQSCGKKTTKTCPTPTGMTCMAPVNIDGKGIVLDLRDCPNDHYYVYGNPANIHFIQDRS